MIQRKTVGYNMFEIWKHDPIGKTSSPIVASQLIHKKGVFADFLVLQMKDHCLTYWRVGSVIQSSLKLLLLLSNDRGFHQRSNYMLQDIDGRSPSRQKVFAADCLVVETFSFRGMELD
eukprot:scaffold13220_cov91-Cylindrotheca_fusiformis.AAC.2